MILEKDMFYKRILPIALCFLMLGNYSEGSCAFAEDGKRWRLRLPEIETMEEDSE